jgi:dihydrofolate reductase
VSSVAQVKNKMIKTFIIAAQTLDGFIARDKNQLSMDWNSPEDKKRFVTLTKRAGVVVMGSTTYKTFNKPLKDRLNIIYSRSGNFEGCETTSDEPSVLLKKLEERGFTEVAICGGSEIYSMFINAGLVDTIYLTVEPVYFGEGIKLFSKKIDKKLSLINLEKTEGGTLFLEYKVN